LKVLPFKIPKSESDALIFQEDRAVVFYSQLHQHKEVQISFIAKGTGTLIVGDKLNEYRTNDIFVIGEYVPHVFKSDPLVQTESLMYTLFFDKKCLESNFFYLSESMDIQEFFDRAVMGIKVQTKKAQLADIFGQLKDQNKIERIASLLHIINTINQAETISLSNYKYQRKYTDKEGKRMNVVFNHVIENYQNTISLEEISEKANMSKNAFCRYFKKRTNKTFIQFLIEIRIDQACKLLYKFHERSIATIAVQCGFQNTANFNRKFKKLKGVTPSQFRSNPFQC